MSRLLGLRARLTHLIRRCAADARMDEEIEFHIAMETQRLRHTGVGESEAPRRARAAFGGVEFHTDAARDDRQLPFLELLLLDARFALRTLRRSPAFTVVAIVTLALGIGTTTTTTMFSVLNAVALRETQVTDATHVAVLWTAPALRPAEHLVTRSTLQNWRTTRRVVALERDDGSFAYPVAQFQKPRSDMTSPRPYPALSELGAIVGDRLTEEELVVLLATPQDELISATGRARNAFDRLADGDADAVIAMVMRVVTPADDGAPLLDAEPLRAM